ncbi:putative MATE efflux family protein [Hordeum vulgare]|nr:putative MATE efflux family protein [Hordeum vulgare]
MPVRCSPPHFVSRATPWPVQGVKHARHACHEALVKFGPKWVSYDCYRVKVANELGTGSARRAKFAIANVVVTSFFIEFVLFVFFLVFCGNIAYMFTEIRAVADAVADLSPLLAFSILLNSVQPVLSGVAVGAGWQGVVAYVNITSYYLIGIPLGVVLGYVVGFQVKGIWTVMLVGTLVQTVVLVFITLGTDWQKQVNIAHARLKRWYMDEDTRLQGSAGK